MVTREGDWGQEEELELLPSSGELNGGWGAEEGTWTGSDDPAEADVGGQGERQERFKTTHWFPCGWLHLPRPNID